MTHRQFMVIELPEGIDLQTFAAALHDELFADDLELRGLTTCQDDSLGKAIAEQLDNDNDPRRFSIDLEGIQTGL